MSKELRALAMAANRTCTLNHKQISWFEQTELLDGTVEHSDDAAYIAEASPDVVLALLDRLDRQEKLLREALEYAAYCGLDVPMNDYAEERTDDLIAAIEKELK